MPNWEIIVQALGATTAAAVGLFQLRARLPRSRSMLTHDLEILKALGADDPNRLIVQE